MLAEVPDQFVDYMVLNKILLDKYQAQSSDEEDPETFLNNYMHTNSAGKRAFDSNAPL